MVSSYSLVLFLLFYTNKLSLGSRELATGGFACGYLNTFRQFVKDI